MDVLLPARLVEVERVAVEVCEHVVLKHLLVVVQRELLAAHGADLPVALHVLLELALVVVGWEDDFAQRTSLHVHAARERRGKKDKEEKAEVNKRRSDDVGNPEEQANKEHLSDAWWVACCSANNILHMLQCAGSGRRRGRQTSAAFMGAGAAELNVTWDQSRRQFVRH